MTLIKRGTIKSYDAGGHVATVQMAGSLMVYLDAIPVATDIPAAEVVAGRECTVVFFGDAHDPDDAVIAAVQGALPAEPVDTFLELTDTPGSYGGQGSRAVRVNVAESALEFATIGGGGSKIEDADADTKVDVEESADEDKVRMDVAGSERFVLQAASPQLKVTGALLTTEHIAGKGVSDYEYGTDTGSDDHALLTGRYADLAAATNRVQVFGDSLFGERFDWPEVEAVHDRLRQVDDRNLTTVAEVEDRADAVLRKAELRSASGEITVPVNCGQELYDVVEVTDAVAGLSAAKRRVLGLALEYSTGERAVYRQRITLGAV